MDLNFDLNLNIYLFTAAVLAVTAGHIFRAQRWGSFIRVYEDADFADMLRSMFLGYTTDIFLPFHAGDIVRAGYMGKKLANKTAFSLATIIIDRLLDVFAVALIYFAFYLHGHPECFKSFMLFAASAVLISALLMWSVMFDKPLKKLILAFSSVFNDKIQLWLLAFSWAGICTIKNISSGINKLRLFLNTVCMWFFYILAYKLLAMAANGTGTLQIFNIMFLPQGVGALTLTILLFNAATCLALLVCSLICGLLCKQKTKRPPELIIPYISENGRLDFLKIYFSNIHDRKYINDFLELNRDVDIIANRSAGSNATTLLCIKNGSMIFRKYAFGSEADKLAQQVRWLEKNRTALPVAKVLGFEKKNGSFCYDMPHLGTASDFFSYIHSATEDDAWQILSNMLDDLEKNYKAKARGKADSAVISAYFNAKIAANLKKITSAPQLKPLLNYKTLVINKKEYKNLPFFADRLNDENFWQDIFKNDIYTEIHGDLTVENIIYGGESGYYLIDPNGGNIHDAPALDMAKLMQSLHGGYEFLMHTYEVNVNGSEISFLMPRSSAYNRLYARLKQHLAARFGNDGLKSIFFHEIVHWLRLMPYKTENDSSRAPMFYAGMIMVINDIFEEFC